MAYHTKVLQPDETVKVVGRLHWSIYIRGLVVLMVAVALLVGSLWLSDPDGQRYAQWAAGVVGVLGLLLLLAAWIRRLGTEIVVTDRRIILNHGLLSRRTMEMNMSKIEMVDVRQSLWGRIWGYGTVKIHGTGVDIEALKGIGSPLAIRNAIVVG
jgi:membrane protein YdbS with pleckstrin-like domain